MENVVVDSSVAIKWFANEVDSDKARQLLKQYLDGEIKFYVPDLFYSEVGNIFWKKVSMQGFKESDANESFEKLSRVEITVSSTISLHQAAMLIALKHNRTFYDSLYIALSQEIKCDFITADERMFNAVHREFPAVKLLSTSA